MRRIDLEHIIRAAGAITGSKEIIIVGSQAILGQFPAAEGPLSQSIEADVFTFRAGEDSDLIDGSIGEQTAFHHTFGYYAHGVALETAVLPSGWRERLVPILNENTQGVTGLCLEVHDLCASKLIAGREKDLDFVQYAIQRGYAKRAVIKERLRQCGLVDERANDCIQRLNRLAG
jgi:hypothetical protein